ncbi:hypothetical protein PtA15_12A27 [Puccinia triticina]|uniref:Uncharacterized protein n=1 Tax=Puccinia triticina TaxID=208348 RepID=A0ABY7D542_9BASI|nr:uncharacterized protein PtA15_12A27 [Puccinia triticina]WAQ90042.1 hypothetical protein PtA15_12A27 [Puccinia triticina]
MRFTASSLCLSIFICQLADSTRGVLIPRIPDGARATEAAASSSQPTRVSYPAASMQYWIFPAQFHDVEKHLAFLEVSPHLTLEERRTIYEKDQNDIIWRRHPGKIPFAEPGQSAEYESLKIQLEFKYLVERQGTSVSQILKWLATLSNAIYLLGMTGDLNTPHMAVSASYGLYSLMRMYPLDDEGLLEEVNKAILYFQKIFKQGRNAPGNYLRWETELLNPSAGFSPEIANLDEFRAIFEKDPQISKAVSIHREEREEPLKALAANFSSSSSHKRVTTLAVFYHVLTQDPMDQLYTTQFQRIRSQPTLFLHEQELIEHVPYHT